MKKAIHSFFVSAVIVMVLIAAFAGIQRYVYRDAYKLYNSERCLSGKTCITLQHHFVSKANPKQWVVIQQGFNAEQYNALIQRDRHYLEDLTSDTYAKDYIVKNVVVRKGGLDKVLPKGILDTRIAKL